MNEVRYSCVGTVVPDESDLAFLGERIHFKEEIVRLFRGLKGKPLRVTVIISEIPDDEAKTVYCLNIEPRGILKRMLSPYEDLLPK